MKRKLPSFLAVLVLCIASFFIGRWSGFSLDGVDIEGVTAEANAVKIASLECQAAALNDRLIALTEAVSITGTASHYGHIEDGWPTASGEIFDRRAMTAAVVFPLKLKMFYVVTRLDTGASVRIWANDRLPGEWKRIVDLSEAAAEQIGMIDKGIVKVKIVPELQ